MLTHMLGFDVDISENMEFDNTLKQIQSAYFRTHSATLMVGVLEYLNLEIWSNQGLVLEAGDEVSYAADNGLFHHGVVQQAVVNMVVDDAAVGAIELNVRVKFTYDKVNNI